MIFQSELTSLDSELSQLQALLSAKQQQRNLYNQLQQQTEGYLVGLAKLKDQIAETVGGGALASLKSAVLNLFDPGDHGDSGGNQPTVPTPDDDPAPGADDDEPSFIDEDSLEYPTLEGQFCDVGHDLDWYWERCAKLEGQAWEFASFLELDKPLAAGSRFWFGGKENTGTVIRGLKDEYLCQIDGAVGEVKLERLYLHYVSTTLEGQSCDIDKAPKTGQKCSWATPFASPLCSLLWEDAPLLGQHCTITLSATEDNGYKSTSEGEAMPKTTTEMVLKNANCGYLKLKTDGRILGVYCWFSRKNIAEAWFDYFDGMGIGNPVLRLSQRSSSWKYEIRLTGLGMNQIERLSQETLWQKPQKKKIESPAQAAGIEPPSGWRKVQAQEQPITPGALVRHCVDAKFNIFQYGILQEASSSSAEVWFEQDGVSKRVDLATIELIAADPQYAKVLAGVWAGKNFVVIRMSKANQGYSLLTPQGIIWFRADGVEIIDAEIQEIAPTAEPEQAKLPIYQRSDGGFEVEQAIQESASILEVGDIVEVTGTRHPQHFGLVGTVEALSSFSELPISVRTPRGLKGYLRSDLKLISKGENPQSQGLQSGQRLMGDRIVTSGNYIGSARISRMLNAQLGTADKIAAIELAKDLKNLGFDPRLAAAVMAGEDDASDF